MREGWPRELRFIPTPVGNAKHVYFLATEARFIPTPVGNALPLPAERQANPVHPHARGEREVVRGQWQSLLGSSPRPWGTPDVSRATFPRFRFIPTPVGNAPRCRWRRGLGAVHPHARGERLESGVQVGVDGRFIPTPVGNAPVAASAAVGSMVHPHARGEREDFFAVVRHQLGSSPRPWGTPGRHPALPRLRRFIPTPVGNACTQRPRCAVWTVHPHARGERPPPCGHRDRPCGSSPRPWGTPLCAGACASICWFIPTPVGNART